MSNLDQIKYNTIKEVLFSEIFRWDMVNDLKRYLDVSPIITKNIIRDHYDHIMDTVGTLSNTYEFLKERFPDLYETYTGQPPDYSV